MEYAVTQPVLVFGAFGVLVIFLAVFGVVSVMLNYHWTHYGVEAQKIKEAQWWYFGVSGLLFFTMALAFLYLL